MVHLKSVIDIDSEDKAAIRDSDQRQQQQFDRYGSLLRSEESEHHGIQKKRLLALLSGLNL